MIRAIKHTTDSTDAAVLKSELLDDLKSDLINAIRNNNPVKIAQLKRDIEVVEKWKV